MPDADGVRVPENSLNNPGPHAAREPCAELRSSRAGFPGDLQGQPQSCVVLSKYEVIQRGSHIEYRSGKSSLVAVVVLLVLLVAVVVVVSLAILVAVVVALVGFEEAGVAQAGAAWEGGRWRLGEEEAVGGRGRRWAARWPAGSGRRGSCGTPSAQGTSRW